MPHSEMFGIHGWATIWKYLSLEHYLAHDPFVVIQTRPNELMYGGASFTWGAILGFPPDVPFTSPFIGVGDGTGGGKTLNDLTGGAKFRKGMTGGYPQWTDGFAEINTHAKFRSLFMGGEANFHWREWGLFDLASGGRMLNHQVQDNGRKKPGMVWDMLTEFTIQ